MPHRLAPALGLFAILVAACGGSTGSTAPLASAAAPSVAAPSAAAPSAAAPSAAGGSAPPSTTGGGACTVSTGTATVAVTIQGFAFSPATITAKVGDVIGFTNKDSVGHTATLDDASCSTDTIAAGASGALTFTAAGSYPFHCKIHPKMMGTITVS